MNSSNLEILSPEEYSGARREFNDEDWNGATNIVSRYYNLVLADCGAGLFQPAARGVLSTVSGLVIVASASIDGARQAAVTMDWLRQNGYQDLLGRSCVVINHVVPGKPNIDVTDLVQQFERHVPPGRVVVLPWDKHIAAPRRQARRTAPSKVPNARPHGATARTSGKASSRDQSGCGPDVDLTGEHHGVGGVLPIPKAVQRRVGADRAGQRRDHEPRGDPGEDAQQQKGTQPAADLGPGRQHGGAVRSPHPSNVGRPGRIDQGTSPGVRGGGGPPLAGRPSPSYWSGTARTVGWRFPPAKGLARAHGVDRNGPDPGLGRGGVFV